MTAPARFTQNDITRAMKAAKAAGFPRVRVTVDPNGTLVIDGSEEAAMALIRDNPLDRILRR